MRSSGGIHQACRLAGVVAIAVLMAACARHGTPQEYGLGSTGSVATPGSPQEFAVNVGDLVHFQQDSSALTGESKSILMNQVRWL
jgi:peptidoglycan-associated lipoprotein